MTSRTFALLFGIVFLLVGIGGFIPGLVTMPHPEHPHLIVTQNYGQLFGLFPINIVHNMVHIVFGIWGLVSCRSAGTARLYARGVAIIYGALTIAGFVPGLETMFGFIPLFQNDIWLHGLLALIAAFFGWVHRDPAAPSIGGAV